VDDVVQPWRCINRRPTGQLDGSDDWASQACHEMVAPSYVFLLPRTVMSAIVAADLARCGTTVASPFRSRHENEFILESV
jgi:hypothetical protein